jgi:Ran GTPase-activating protein (RanGAP) involved in mRNA processing and transport
MYIDSFKINTRFMSGNKIKNFTLWEFTDMTQIEMMEFPYDLESAIISDNFLKALQENKIPDFTTIKESNTFHNANSINQEYHHIIINDICYIVYFN